MKLYIMRHGHAPSTTEARVAHDNERPLSAKGHEGARAAARAILAKGGKPALILHSPLRRAVETAGEAFEVLKPANAPEIFLPLSNALPAERLLEALRAPLEKAGELLIVGHQPQLGELAQLVGGELFDLPPAGLVALELAAGESEASDAWVYHPA